EKTLQTMAAQCRENGLSLWLDVSLATALVGGVLAGEHPQWYRAAHQSTPSLDPRLGSRAGRTALLVTDPDGEVSQDFLDYWATYLDFVAKAGVTGVRVHAPQCLTASAWTSLIDTIREAHPDFRFTAW